QLANQVNRRIKIAVKRTPRKNRIGVSRPVEFELIHAVIPNHPQTNIEKTLVVLRAGERETSVHNLVTLLRSKSNALLLRTVVSAPWRQPNPRRSAVWLRRIAHRPKPV